MRYMDFGLTYDDVMLVPGPSRISPSSTDLSTQLSRNIRLKTPLVAAAAKTAANGNMAAAIARLGGIGIIHRGPSIESQVKEVLKVKREETGVVSNPMTVTPDMRLADLRALVDRALITSFPVVEAGGLLIGLVTHRDLRFSPSSNEFVRDVMTPLERLVTMCEGEPIARAQQLMHEHRIERVLVVSEALELRGIVTAKDIANRASFPEACRDAEGRLLVGATVGVSSNEQLRFRQLVEAGVDVIVINARHGHSHALLSQVDWAKRTYPNVDVIAGNVLTGEAAQSLVDCGADGIKVGTGSGWRAAHGVGVPLLSALFDVQDALGRNTVPIIADGGIRQSGDIAKALAAGASSVTIDDLFAAAGDMPGQYSCPDRCLECRGAAASRVVSPADPPGEGIESGWEDEESNEGSGTEVDCRSVATRLLPGLLRGLRMSMSYCGTRSVGDMRPEANFVRMTSTAIPEIRMRTR